MAGLRPKMEYIASHSQVNCKRKNTGENQFMLFGY